MKKIISTICCMLALVLSLTACAQSEPAPAAVPTEAAALADGGTILLSVNPEIAVDYDNSGFVTGIAARNDDAFKILANYEGFNGKQAHTVVSELVSVIGEAGYFVEEVEGEPRQIILEIEPGSAIPGAHFVDYVVREVQKTIDENSWQTPLNLDGISDYGSTDYTAANPGANTNYNTSDYNTVSDGVTDYNQPVAGAGGTDYSNSGYGTTDYAPSDYGTTDNDATDYDTTDYDNSNTDYDTSDYGGSNTDYGDGNSDYNNTDYDDGNSDYHAPAVTNPPASSGNSDYGNSDYDGDSGYEAPAATNPPASSGNSDYGNSGYGDSAYDAPAPAPVPSPAPSYGGGNSGYSDYGGGSDSGYSNYGGGGDSGYSDYSGYGES